MIKYTKISGSIAKGLISLTETPHGIIVTLPIPNLIWNPVSKIWDRKPTPSPLSY